MKAIPFLVAVGMLIAVAWKTSGSRPEDVPLNLGENPYEHMPRKQAMALLLNLYKPRIEEVVVDVTAHVPANYQNAAGSIKLRYDETDETFFSFYRDENESHTISISLGGMNALDVSATALAIQSTLEPTQHWWLNYMLYHRALRRHPNTGWIGPFDAAGFMEGSVTPEEVQRLGRITMKSEIVLHDMLAFVIAHEVGHVVLGHHGIQNDDETYATYLERMREQEKAADAFALETVTTMKSVKIPSLAIFALLAHLLVADDTISGEESKHPPDWQRISEAVNFLANQSDNPTGLNVAAARTFVSALSDIRTYQELDSLAQQVSLDSLKITTIAH
jgi:hypothetical protein